MSHITGVFPCPSIKAILLLSAATVLCAAIRPLPAKQAGMFGFKDAFDNHDNDTVLVNDSIVAIGGRINVNNIVFYDTLVDTPTLFFIIDNSASMYYSSGHDVHDLPGHRFRATLKFIDSIYAQFPSTEVGVAVITGGLFFRAKDSPHFVSCPVSYDSGGGYLPLLKLNKLYSSQTGIAVIKSFLQTKISGSGDPAELIYTPSEPPPEGSNITIGFEAAKKAFSAATTPKSSHYVIFVTDGEADAPPPGSGHDPQAYQNGAGAPTTFTFFFTTDDTVTAGIVKMTKNISNNGYSPYSSLSKCWPLVNTSYDSLLLSLRKIICVQIPVPFPYKPVQLTLNGATFTGYLDSSFFSVPPQPLSGALTREDVTIKYRPLQYSGKDSSRSISFFVKTQPGIVMPPDSFECACWDRDIGFGYNDSPITVATEAMSRVELSFPWNGGIANYNYTNVTIDLFTSVPPVDHETVRLVAGTHGFTGTFKRASSAAKTVGNGVLENAASGEDSIIAVFRNSETPKLPLDTVRVAIPFSSSAVLPNAGNASVRDFRYSIFRQPSGFAVKIMAPSGNRSFDAAVFNAAGKVVVAPETYPSSAAAIRLPRASGGIYFLRIVAGNGTVIKKIVVP